MSLADFYSGEWASGHKAPTAEQTNPNNDPEIAASQARLRAIAAFDFTKATPRMGAWKVVSTAPVIGSGDTGESDYAKVWVRDVIYDTPGGAVVGKQSVPAASTNGMTGAKPPDDAPPPPPSQLNLQSEEKYWWKPGLAERFSATVGPDGHVTNVTPRDSKKSLGESIAEFAGSVVALGATGLAAYGAAYGLGSTVGTGVGTGTGTTAGGSTAAAGTTAEASTVSSIQGLEAAEGWALQGGGAGYTPAASSAAAGGAGASVNPVASEAAAAYSDAGVAGYGASGSSGAAPITQAAASTGGGSTVQGASTAGNYWDALFGGSGSGGFWERVGAGVVSQVGQGIIDDQKREEDREDKREQRAHDERMLAEDRAYKARNMGAASMVSVNWGLVQVAKRPEVAPQNPYSADAPPSALNTPRLPPGPIQTPVIDSASDIYKRNGNFM